MSKKVIQTNKNILTLSQSSKNITIPKEPIIPIKQSLSIQQARPKTPQKTVRIEIQNLNTQQRQMQQALQRLNQLQQASQQTHNKKVFISLNAIFENVQKDIITSKVEIPTQSQQITQFLHRKKYKKESQKKSHQIQNESQLLDREYRSLLQKKQNILDQLRSIQQQQSSIKKNLHDSSVISTSRQRLNKMPTLTEQDRQHWLKIKQMVKQHEENSKMIKQVNRKKEEQQIKLQNQLQQKKKRQRSEQKLKIIEKNIDEIKKRHNQRSQHIKQSQALIQKLKKKTKLFQKMQENWQNLEHELKLENQAAFFDNYQNKRLINVREIKKYEQEYDMRVQQQQQKRSHKLKQSKATHPANSFQRTKFSVDILQQAKKIKELQQQKLHQIKQLISRKKQYATNIKQKYRSVSRLEKIKQKQQASHANDNKQGQNKQLKRQMRSMTALDIRNKGNQYMKSINTTLKIARSQSRKQINKKPLQLIQKHTYKNYLPQVTKKNTSKQQNQNNTKPTDIQLLNSILTKQKASTQQKFYQVQKITKKMQYGGTQKNLLNSINAKIEVLKRLSLSNNNSNNKQNTNNVSSN